MNKKLAHELMKMMKADMKMRFRVIAKKEKLDANLDRKHVQRLREIIMQEKLIKCTENEKPTAIINYSA